MSSADKIHALRGMRDVFSADYARQRRVQTALEDHLRSHAYVPIDLPLVENTELFLRKSGEDIAARLYEFNFKSRRIALRPELTASVLRAYVEHLQDEPLPLRIQYRGPVFRYEKPQQNRLRQFTLCGAELLGAAGPMADAEMIHLACAGLENLPIRSLKLIIGHTGVLQGFLGSLGLRKQLQSFLLRNMENVRKRGMRFVIDALGELYPELNFSADDFEVKSSTENATSQQLIAVLREMNEDEARRAITEFLHSLSIRIDTNRAEDEVIDRLLHKIREDEQAPRLRRALEYMRRLSELVGPPQQVLERARELFDDFDVHHGTLGALEIVLEKLAHFGPLDTEIELDFGLNRGLHYYTGLIFEIRTTSRSGDEIQLCGGGRYDNLVSVLGGNEPTPALGFAWGVERIASALDEEETETLNRPHVFVAPIAEDDLSCAIQVARRLRERGLVVELSIDERSLRRSLKHADRKDVSVVAVIGENEREQERVVLRDMRNRRNLQVNLVDLESAVEGLLRGDESIEV